MIDPETQEFAERLELYRSAGRCVKVGVSRLFMRSSTCIEMLSILIPRCEGPKIKAREKGWNRHIDEEIVVGIFPKVKIKVSRLTFLPHICNPL